VISFALASTPVDSNVLVQWLSDYPNREDAAILSNGFREGFKLLYSGPRLPTEAKNLKSAIDAPHIVREKLGKEVEAGRIAGPFDTRPIASLRVSPLGLVPKKDGDFRLIHHLSYPEGSSVNDFLDPELCSVEYTSIDKVVAAIQQLGKGTLLAKSDVKRAFRLLRIWPGDFDLLGMKFEGQYYFDKCLPMGCSMSCALFEKFSTFIEWYVQREAAQVVQNSSNTFPYHYLDDFIFGGGAGTSVCKTLLDLFYSVCNALGVPIAHEKTVEPTEILEFLGLEFNTILMQIKIPDDKVHELQKLLLHIASLRRVTLKTLQSLIGSLNFACRAIVPGRAFCRRFIDATRGIKHPHHRIKVTAGMKKDLGVWSSFLENFNGVSMFLEPYWDSDVSLQLFTDAAAGIGFGIYFQGDWAADKWPQSWKNTAVVQDITFLELFPIVCAIAIWGSQLSGKKIIFRCDNMSVVAIVNSQTSKSPRVMDLVRQLVLMCLRHNIFLRARHVKGTCNGISDALSRGQFQRFRALATGANEEGRPIPDWMWRI
jgi:hypothetical protein